MRTNDLDDYRLPYRPCNRHSTICYTDCEQSNKCISSYTEDMQSSTLLHIYKVGMNKTVKWYE